MKKQYLSLRKFKYITVGLTIHGSSFKDRHFVVKATETQQYRDFFNKAKHYFILFLFIEYL